MTYWSQIPNDVDPNRQISIDSGVILNDWLLFESQIFNDVAAYNLGVNAYNTAIAAEKTRVADLKAIFEPVNIPARLVDFFNSIFNTQAIPARPCPFNYSVAKYSGPWLWGNLTGLTVSDNAAQTLEKNAKAGYL